MALALAGATIFAILFVLAGCGGSGGGDGSGAVTGRMTAFWSDWEHENSNITSRNFSTSYYNNGYTYSDIIDLFDTLFSEPNTTYHVTNKVIGHVDINGDFAQMDGSYRVVVNESGSLSNIDVFGPFTFIREGGVWRFYGDQTNVAARVANIKATGADSPKVLGSDRQ